MSTQPSNPKYDQTDEDTLDELSEAELQDLADELLERLRADLRIDLDRGGFAR